MTVDQANPFPATSTTQSYLETNPSNDTSAPSSDIPYAPQHVVRSTQQVDARTQSDADWGQGNLGYGSTHDATTSGMQPLMSPEAVHVTGMQKWEGRVTEVSEHLLTAELTPLDHDGPAVLADFDIAQLAPDDDDVQPGDIIYLTVRWVRDHGYATTTAAVRRKRMGSWLEHELDEARTAARGIVRSLNQYAE